jgi:hypothetical protein
LLSGAHTLKNVTNIIYVLKHCTLDIYKTRPSANMPEVKYFIFKFKYKVPFAVISILPEWVLLSV